MFKQDLHIHTKYSPDSNETMENVILTAIEKNLDAICFTDHIDIAEPFYSLLSFDFDGRIKAFENLKSIYGKKIKMLLGLEFAEPNIYQDDYKRILSEYPYDMIIGSVHEPADLHYVGKITADQMSVMYYDRLIDMAKKGGFDVLAHLDFPKKFFRNFKIDYEKSRKVIDICVANGIVLEINTSTLRMGLNEPCPSMDLVEYYRDCGGKYVTINSDSHSCESVGSDFARIYKALPIGLQLCYFEKRKMVVSEQR